MSRAVAATLAAVLLLGSLATAPAVGTSGAERLQTPDRFDSTRFQISLYENGSATWTIRHYQPLNNESQVEQFEAYASDFESNETSLYRDFRRDATALTRPPSPTWGPSSARPPP